MKNSKNIIPWSVQKNVKLLKVDKTLGCYFWIKNKKYLDFCSQLVNLNLGFQSPNIIKAIIKQTKKISFVGPKFDNDKREKLADLFSKIVRSYDKPSNSELEFLSIVENRYSKAKEDFNKISKKIKSKEEIKLKTFKEFTK